MKNVRLFISIAISLLFLTPLSAVISGGTALADTSSKHVLKWSTYVTPKDIRYKELVLWSEMMEEASGGRLKLEIHHSNSLFPFTQWYDGLRTGLADGSPAGMAWDERFKATGAIQQAPFAVDMSRIHEFDQEILEVMRPELEKFGLVAIYEDGDAVTQDWFSMKLARTPEEYFKGKVIRAGGSALNFTVTTHGGTPAVFSQEETFSAIEKGTIDGANFGLLTFHGWGLHRKMPWMIRAAQFMTTLPFVVTKESYDKLPPDLQKILMDTGQKLRREVISKIYIDEINRVLGEMSFEGFNVYSIPPEDLPAWTKPVEGPWKQKILDRTAAAGFPDMGPKAIAVYEKYARY
jgi:TRAP-type C4-dicarboxylate transport system substrate-binding protein